MAYFSAILEEMKMPSKKSGIPVVFFTAFLFIAIVVIGFNVDITERIGSRFVTGEIAGNDLPSLLEYSNFQDSSESPFPWVLATADAKLTIDNVRNNDIISIPLLGNDVYAINKTRLIPCLEHPNYQPEWCEQGAEIFEGTIMSSGADKNSVIFYLLPSENRLTGNINPQPGLTDYGVQFESGSNDSILVTFYDPELLPPPL